MQAAAERAPDVDGVGPGRRGSEEVATMSDVLRVLERSWEKAMSVEDSLARARPAASRRIRPRHRWPAARSVLRCSAHGAEEAVDREVADPVAVLDPFVHRLAEVESDKDPRDPVLLRGGGEGGIAAGHR